MAGVTFEQVYVDPRGRTARIPFIIGLVLLAAVAGFYVQLVGGRTAEWAATVMIFPGAILHARRLHDIGVTGWLVVVPAALLFAAAWAHFFYPEFQYTTPLLWAGLGLSAAFAVWGLIGKSQAGANRYGTAATA